RHRLVEAVKPVAGQHALGEDDQPGATAGRRPQPLADGRQVVRLVAEPAVHLHAGDLPGRAHRGLAVAAEDQLKNVRPSLRVAQLTGALPSQASQAPWSAMSTPSAWAFLCR